jgi:tRNA threonylcarbamoyladenosine biosynthesis protein TsaE
MSRLGIITESAQETQKLGIVLAKEIIHQLAEKALVIGLEGELGSGKTTFIQGLAKGLGIKERLTSPTFVILKRYGRLFHLDCYRINKPEEILDLDFKEILNQPEDIIVIEWAEKVKKILPKNTLWIKFEHLGQDKRRISLRITNDLQIYK